MGQQMVQVRDRLPKNDLGSIDINQWVRQIDAPQIETERLLTICEFLKPLAREGSYWGEHVSVLEAGMEIAQILAELELDTTPIVVGLIYRAVREQHVKLTELDAIITRDEAKLIQGVLSMAAISKSRRKSSQQGAAEHLNQKDNVRKMLVSMTDDVRVALIKLAERTSALRAVKNDAKRREHVAIEVTEIYAPLAHRLGIGHIKWELEDLSFKYLKPDQYAMVASELDERRLDREQFISQVEIDITAALKNVGVEAQVTGRAKHIYSIWRKMQLKNYSFNQLYDIRAFRILVKNIAECYTTLGTVHSLYKHIPRQFDDYITNPKVNGYRSLHTAVFGPGAKTMEVQIRTLDMHDEAELGVCAHWKYKGTDTDSTQSSYESKLEWLRHVLDWHDSLDESADTELTQTVKADRIYVFSKAGHVIDLPIGATPLDFAYRIHSDVGNTCKGAKVSGRIVPLNHVLQTGDQVEVLTAKNSRPSRDWLNAETGYITTSRARAKIIHWFKNDQREDNELYGRQSIEAELKRLGLSTVNLKKLAKLVNYKDPAGMYAAVGAGDLRASQVSAAAQRMLSDNKTPVSSEIEEVFQKNIDNAKKSDGDVEVLGVGNLMSTIAHCCNPLPGDEITGYITLNRGVSIHRQECSNVIRLAEVEPARIVALSWSGGQTNRFSVDIEIEATDRSSLLRDITALISNEKADVAAVYSQDKKNPDHKYIGMTLSIPSLEHLSRVLNKLAQLPGVLDARRKRAE